MMWSSVTMLSSLMVLLKSCIACAIAPNVAISFRYYLSAKVQNKVNLTSKRKFETYKTECLYIKFLFLRQQIFRVMAEEKYTVTKFPPQRISNSHKTKKWREDCVRFAENMSVLGSSSVRKSKRKIKLNYELYGGKIDMRDVENILNPEGIDYGIPTKPIQHYPVMNAKVNILLGEEWNTQFEDRAVITNPTSISELEQEKIEAVKSRIQEEIAMGVMDQQQLQAAMQQFQMEFNYEYQDIREKNVNDLLNHYKKEYNFESMYNDGFEDALVAGMEVYYNYIECGEPMVERVNLKELSFWGSTSNRIEDYPYVVRERYLSASDIIDMWGDKMSASDYRKFDQITRGEIEGNGTIYTRDDYYHFRYGDDPGFVDKDGFFSFEDNVSPNEIPFDISGSIRVLEVFWKSMCEIRAIHYFDENGEEQVKFRTADYILDENAGETEKKYWKNEAWHGVMIGAGKDAIFVDVGPCQVQHNRMGNPSRCHFGFVGNIYNNNDYEAMTMVDMMKPLSYKYDVVMHKLDELIARNKGKLVIMDGARVPAGWSEEKWAYFLNLGIVAVDSFKEGAIGQAKGKLAGGVANTPFIADAELSGSIQAMVEQLMFIDNSMKDLLGITPQRMGNVQNRETVGGVERAVIQSSNITRRMEMRHNDLKRREEECFLEYAKIAMRGKNKKFQFIMADNTVRNVTIDGVAFAEPDYGIVVENGYDTQALSQKVDMIAQANAQNGLMSTASYLILQQTVSLSEKIRLIRREEMEMRQQQQEAQQAQQQAEQQKLQLELQLKQAELELLRENNIRDNETKLLIEQLKAQANADIKSMEQAVTDDGSDKREEQSNDMEKFRQQMELERRKLDTQLTISREANRSKEKIAAMRPRTSITKK